ncbi:MAG: hypothetical protein KDK04_22525 [Candidatus Competibacteraceae bacterium]|nr:hypothetical protein [Candidatus Competibacteraceae bacterium]
MLRFFIYLLCLLATKSAFSQTGFSVGPIKTLATDLELLQPPEDSVYIDAGFYSIDFAPDGGLYVTASLGFRIIHISPSGAVTSIAGTGEKCEFPYELDCGEGGPATNAKLALIYDIDVAPDGSIYLSESSTYRIRKIDPNGAISIVAGTGNRDYSGDGGSATSAELYHPLKINVDLSGNLYIEDIRIRKVDQNGIINEFKPPIIFNTPSTELLFKGFSGIKPSYNNEFFILSNSRIFKIDSTGILSHIAGNGTNDHISGNGGAAINSGLTVGRMDSDKKGNLYFLETGVFGKPMVRRVSVDGTIDLVAGGGDSDADEIHPYQAKLGNLNDIAVSQNNIVCISERKPMVNRSTLQIRCFEVQDNAQEPPVCPKAGEVCEPEGWPDLTPLTQHYEASKGEPEAAYIHQVLCIASNSCEDYEEDRENSWANGFVKYLFDYLLNPSGLPKSTKVKCPDFIKSLPTANSTCLAYMGYTHQEELRKGFASYCSSNPNGIDYEKWDEDHNNFLIHGVAACFDEVAASGELSAFYANEYKVGVIAFAAGLRERTQYMCNAPDLPPKSQFQNIYQEFEYNKSKPSQLPSPLSKDVLFLTTLADSGSLDIFAEEDLFFLPVGTTVQLHTIRKNSDGSTTDLTGHPNNKYHISSKRSHIRVSPDGKMTVLNTLSALVNERPQVMITVTNDDDVGFGQFAITDKDSDNDLVVDSYEILLGRNPTAADSLDADQDGDTLSDVAESFLGTNPLTIDTDRDGFNDDIEVKAKFDPLNPLCNESIGCNEFTPRLTNISTNGHVNDFGLHAGFIVQGEQPQRFIVLGERFNSGIDATLTLTDASGISIYQSDNWLNEPTANEIQSKLGRSLGDNTDAGFAITLNPGVYIAKLESKNGQFGNGIVAINNTSLDTGQTQLINLSTNGLVNDFGLHAGFIVSGDSPLRVVVLGEKFQSNIDATLKLEDSLGNIVYTNDNWLSDRTSAEVESTIGRRLGDNTDAGFAITLDPGVYIAKLQSKNGQFGNGIIAVNVKPQ